MKRKMKTREEDKENGKIFFNETKREIVDLKGGPNQMRERRKELQKE